MRVQVIVALVALLVLVAVPLYLWRRPRSSPVLTGLGLDAGAIATTDLGADGGFPDAGAFADLSDAGMGKRVTLAEVRTVKCVAERGGKVPPERCERLTSFEDALTRSIRENVACAPPSPSGGTVSFVLTIDFKKKKTHLWAGKSGTIKRRNAAELVRCVSRGIPPPVWSTLQHQYQRYDIGVLATYPGAATTSY